MLRLKAVRGASEPRIIRVKGFSLSATDEVIVVNTFFVTKGDNLM